ncbi:MAG: monovalent cation/H+ antiporter subunit D family protein [Thermodesulfobacteriota bacterium]|nr:monovalent cation/H+ antiporter subunit D family protein [Thermodesulfobacteriota bacterium]
METVKSIAPICALLVPLIAIPFIALAGQRRPNVREFWTILASVIMFLIVASMLPRVQGGEVIEYQLLTLFPGLDLNFRVDAFGLFFGLVASFLWIITSFYSIGYMRSFNEHAQTRYYICFAISLFGALGVAFAANLITILIFYEILTLSTYPLVIHEETPEAIKGARRYLTYLLGTSIAFNLPAIFLTYTVAQTLEFSNAGILAGKASPLMIAVIFILFIAGIGKSAMMPFHSWLPAAMVAPTPVSALLHAVAVVKAGVFTVLRVVFHVFGIDLLSEIGLGTALAYFASFTIIVASIMALKQDNLKLRLAYSTVSQLSYIVLGASLLSGKGMMGGILHIVMHAFGKITLFFCAGSILIAVKRKNISEMSGIGKKIPITMFAFFLGALSIIGFPPFGGFLSKWYLVLGSLEANQIPILIVILTSSFLNGAYFLPIVYRAFFGELDEKLNDAHEASSWVVVPLVLTALISMVLFFYPQPFWRLAALTVKGLTGG